MTDKILGENNDLRTLTLFETHANTMTKEYQFHTPQQFGIHLWLRIHYLSYPMLDPHTDILRLDEIR